MTAIRQSTLSAAQKRRNIVHALVLGVLAVICLLFGAVWPVLADTAGEIGAHVASQGSDLGKAVSVVFYVLGMAAGGAAFLKLKANRDNPQQHPLSHAVVLATVCAGLLFLPETFQSTGDTIFNKNAVENNIAGTTQIGN